MRIIVRKMSSTGSVTTRSVSITTRELGWVDFESNAREERAIAWRAVDNRETKMDPTLPGRPKKHLRFFFDKQLKLNTPLMTTASRAKPSYRLMNRSRIIPVPLLMTIAPKSGDQPCVMRCFT